MTEAVPVVTTADQNFVNLAINNAGTVEMSTLPAEMEELTENVALPPEHEVIKIDSDSDEDGETNDDDERGHFISYQQFAAMFRHLGPPSPVETNEDLYDLYY